MQPARHLLIAALAMAALVPAAPAAASHSELDLISDPNGTNAARDAAYVGPKGGNSDHFHGVPDVRNWWQAPVADGSHAFYVTSERLVDADRDESLDLYDHSWVTLPELVPDAGQSACWPITTYGNCPFAASSDGRHVFFVTSASLVPEDTDGYSDIYERFGGQVRLVSTGPTGGNGPYPFCGPTPCRQFHISVDGERVFFETRESLVPEDTDDGCTFRHDAPCTDLYERSNGTTKLVSTGPTDSHGAHDACADLFCTFNHPFPVSVDGDHVFFLTDDRLVSTDQDNSRDLYDRSNGTTTLISIGPAGGNGGFEVIWGGASADGSKVFFQTAESLLSEDQNGQTDIYQRSGDATTIIPRGPPQHPFEGSGSIPWSPSYDGSRYFFSTLERLVAADTDTSYDLYAQSDDGVELISIGPSGGNGQFDVCSLGGARFPCIEGASRDGSRVFFTTREALVSEDTDSACPGSNVGETVPCVDIYERSNGTTKLISTGPADTGPGEPFDGPRPYIEGVSADGSRAFFSTKERLVTEDMDGGKVDIYERSGGQTTLISAGPEGPGSFDSILPIWGGMSADGSVVYFTTGNPLLPEDTDRCFTSDVPRGCADVYASRVAPDCSGVTATPATLWPPNMRFRRVVVSDTAPVPLTVSITGVTQDESVVGKADRTSPDARLVSAPEAVQLRAERDPRSDGRVYRIDFRGTDRFSVSCTGTAEVSVPRRRGEAVVDSAPPSFDSFGQ